MVVAALAAVLALGGCGKDDKIVTPQGCATCPPVPSTPRIALANMVRAYEARDSVETLAVYDPTYEGRSTDLASPRPDIVFNRADEIHHVRALHDNPDIVSVAVEFGPPSTWFRLPPDNTDPSDWAILQINSANVEIMDIGTATLHQAKNSMMLYSFKPTVAAPGDTTWKIIKWTEVRN